MSKLVYQKQLQIEGDRGIYCCSWRYVEAKRKDVFEKTLQGAGANPKFRITECRRTAGYLNQSYPNVKEEHEWISNKEISYDEVLALFQK